MLSSATNDPRGKESHRGCISNASSSRCSSGKHDGPQKPVNASSRDNNTNVSDIITKAMYEEMFPYCNDHHCPARAFYTYEAFVAAAARFPAFGATSTLEARKREVAAFFGQTSHETRSASLFPTTIYRLKDFYGSYIVCVHVSRWWRKSMGILSRTGGESSQ